jgi:hypothetical protein
VKHAVFCTPCHHHHHHQQQQQPSSCPSQECTHPPRPNEAPSSMHAGRRMRIPPPSTGQKEYNANKANKTGEQNQWLIGLSACWLICLSTRWSKKAPSSMHAGRRMRVPPPSTGQMEYNADKADKTREPNHLLVGLSACQFGLLHSSTNGGNPCNFFFHLFLFLIGRLVQQQLVGLSTHRLIGLVGLSAHWLIGSPRGMFVTINFDVLIQGNYFG